MPIIRAGTKLLYYAHVPKCGGSSVEDFLTERFGQVAFVDPDYFDIPSEMRWSRTSPQHISLAELHRLFPEQFFDASFTIVRHPVARIVSAYHFQVEVMMSTPANLSFSDWLGMLPQMIGEDPFLYDNHVRPMNDLVPQNARVFHLEHGIDAIVPWLDAVTGDKSGPRAIKRVNERKGRSKLKTEPTQQDLAFLREFYAADFERFGYTAEERQPRAAAPELGADFIAERDAELARNARPTSWLKQRLTRAIR